MFKIIFKILIFIFVISIAGYFAFNMVMNALIHNKKEAILPNVVGKSLYEAIEELSNAGFGLKKEGEEFNQNMPPGVILRQSPAAGMNIREGRVIRVTISQGGEMIYVPNLVGQTIRMADIALKSSSLILGEVSRRYSVKADKGIVLSQDIEPGSSIDKDSVINIVISDGLPPEDIILMPDFVNKNLQEAREWAQKYEVVINITSENVNDVEDDTILKQFPEADTDITTSKSVNLSTSMR